MAIAHSFHIGWENEHLAHYLLSRFSFVAHPSTNGDDIGSDFYCTIFEVITDGTRQKMEPRISFAIQIKSNHDKIDVTNKIAYLSHLEVPFFVGVVSQKANSLKVYSAECIPMMFAQYGPPQQLFLKMDELPNCKQSPETYVTDGTGDSKMLTLNCRFVCELNAVDTRDTLQSAVSLLLDTCRRASLNLAAKVTGEHLYEWPKQFFNVYAGAESSKHFREAILKRVAEAFQNFWWAHKHDPSNFSVEEVRIYMDFFDKIKQINVAKGLNDTAAARVAAASHAELIKELPCI